MTGEQARLQERRRRRRAWRIRVAVACVVVLILGGLWLNSTKPDMTCGEWQAEYSSAILADTVNGHVVNNGTVANLESVRPEGCQVPPVANT
jgi:heme A synthase